MHGTSSALLWRMINHVNQINHARYGIYGHLTRIGPRERGHRAIETQSDEAELIGVRRRKIRTKRLRRLFSTMPTHQFLLIHVA